MPRARPLPPLDELLAGLEEQGVRDAPRDGPDGEALRALLDMALYVAEHRKRVDFVGFSWEDPGFWARDARVQMRVAYARLHADEDLAALLRRETTRLGHRHALLGLDARGSGMREFDLGHALYGKVTLFAFPHKPAESADPRVHEARERGWVGTLKEHNLLPGRGIVVLDEDQGILLREPALAGLPGILLLLPDGHLRLWWNPFVEADRNDPDMQYWLSWGEGTSPASAWREMLRVEEEKK